MEVTSRQTRNNNMMRTKPVLRVVLKMDDRSSRLGDHGRYAANEMMIFLGDHTTVSAVQIDD